MKKILLMAFVLLALCACSGGDDTTEELTTQYEANIRKTLNGKFHGERKSTIGDIIENEDIEFQPYDKPRQVVSLFGSFNAYGIAITCDYINDNKPFATYRNYYTLDTSKEPFTLSFYRCNDEGNVINRADVRTIKVQSFDLFYMRPYGTTEENNKTYKRQ